MAEIAVSALTLASNPAAIGNCFLVAQKGSDTNSTNRSSISSLQVDYSRVANAYPYGNGDGNAYGVRTVSSNRITPPFQTVNDIWYDIYPRAWTTTDSSVHVINQSTNTFIKAPTMYVKQSNVWKQVQGAWIKDGEVWNQFLYVLPAATNITIAGGTDINLRTEYNNVNGSLSPAGLNISFILAGNAIASSTGTYALQTGSWPEANVNLTLTINGGVYVTGRGGAGGGNGGGGGPAIGLSKALTIINNGTVGGGGGGGGGISYSGCDAGGGGGAGYGAAGTRAGAGGLVSGGGSGQCCVSRCRPGTQWNGGSGGGLGSGGGNSMTLVGRTGIGGPGGCAIIANGNSYTLAGDVRGSRCLYEGGGVL